MSQRVSDLPEVDRLKSSEIGNFMVQTEEGSQRISFSNLKASLGIGDGDPFSDAVELDYSWNDLKNMCKSNKIESDIRVGDFKTITLANSEIVVMEVAGISTYKGFENTGTHIDFISRDCLKDTVFWKDLGETKNNGTLQTPIPYLVSNVYKYLTTTIYGKLPVDILSAIVDKKAVLERRWEDGTNKLSRVGKGCEIKNIGKVWLPSEVEVFGYTAISSGRYNVGDVQYPIFHDGYYKRIKRAGKDGAKCAWWLRNVQDNDEYNAAYVTENGYISGQNVSYNVHRVPLCFRIAAS